MMDDMVIVNKEKYDRQLAMCKAALGLFYQLQDGGVEAAPEDRMRDVLRDFLVECSLNGYFVKKR